MLTALFVLALALAPPAAPAPDTASAAPGTASLPDSLAGPALRFAPVDSIAPRPGDPLRFAEPSGVCVDAFGSIYVTDAVQHQLLRFDARGRLIGEAGSLGSALGDLRRPWGVAALGSRGVVVLDRENQRVSAYDLFGNLAGVLVDLQPLQDALGHVDPVALASDRGGALYVADADHDRVLVFDFSGRFLHALGGYGEGPGSFRGLRGVATGPRGELYTAERSGARLQRLEAGGAAEAVMPLDVKPGRQRLALAVDDSGRVAVADEAAGRLVLLDRDGRLLARTEGLAGPCALAFAPDRTLLVAEAAGVRVRRFRLEAASSSAPAGR